MQPALAAAATAFGVVFLAELGDKSQLLLIAQAGRAPAWRVLVEAIAAFALLTMLAVTVGAVLAVFAPRFVIEVIAGILFLVFGFLSLRAATGQEEPTDQGSGLRYGGTFGLVVVSEMGDKTQLATAALAAASGQAFGTGFGAFAALAASSVLAVAAGRWLAGRLEPRRRAAMSALLFFVLGIATLGWAAWSALA